MLIQMLCDVESDLNKEYYARTYENTNNLQCNTIVVRKVDALLFDSRTSDTKTLEYKIRHNHMTNLKAPQQYTAQPKDPN